MIDLKSLKKQAKDLTSRLFQQNKYERTLKDYQTQAASHPDDMHIRLKIAETYFKARNIEKVIETYTEIAEKYTEQNFILKAVAIYKNILKLDPVRVETNLKLADLYLKLDSIPDAMNQYRIAAQMYSSCGDHQAQLNICKKLVDLDPSPINHRQLGETYHALGMTKEAIEQYEILAQSYRSNKQYDDLLRTYEFILPQKPSNYTMIRDICILYMRKKDPDSAIRTMEYYKVDTDGAFEKLHEKARIMQKALRNT